jgi:hypothetical protein
MERPARDKHSSLLRKFVNCGRKKFYNIGGTVVERSTRHPQVKGSFPAATAVPGKRPKIQNRKKRVGRQNRTGTNARVNAP